MTHVFINKLFNLRNSSIRKKNKEKKEEITNHKQEITSLLCCVLFLLCVSLSTFSRNQKGLQKAESRKVTQRKKQDKQIMFCLIRNYEQQFSIAHRQCTEKKRGNPETGMIQQFTRVLANSVTRIESVWTVLLYLKQFFPTLFLFRNRK